MAILLLILLGTCSYLPELDSLDHPGLRITDHRDFIEMMPTTAALRPVGLMFWPGGLVDPHAYRGSLAPLASRGYPVVIAKVPANLAVLSTNKGWELTRGLQGQWVASGHSLGGAMASWSVHDHPEDFVGLILMAAYPTEEKSLSSWDGPVLSLTAENDGLTTDSDIRNSIPLLPPHTIFYEISGGNHAGFGAYGNQDGDGEATISPENQHQIMADQMEVFLQDLEAQL